MRARTALIVVAVVALVGAAIGLVNHDGSGDQPDTADAPTRAIALDAGGFALVEQLVGGEWQPAIARAGDDGALDTTRAELPLADVTAIAAQGDGRLLVAGESTVDGRRRLAIARLTTDGRLDRSFGTDGVATVAAGDGDVAARGLAAPTAAGIVVTGDATDGDAPAMAIARLDANGGSPQVELIPDARAGGAVSAPAGQALAAGTDTRDGSAVLVRAGAQGAPRTTRARATLTSATWRAVASTPEGPVLVGSGRGAGARSLIAVQRFTNDGDPARAQSLPAGPSDAYGVAATTDPENRVIVAANGVEGDGPAAFTVTLGTDAAPRRRAAGRATGITPAGGLLTTRWDGRRQTVQLIP